MDYKILALGDCNTLGDVEFENNSFVERFGKLAKTGVKNCGYTMSTTREMLHFFKRFYHDRLDVILIQYGLVDSWQTFKYSPYVLYYPNNIFRKTARKFVKKYKKIARKMGLNRKYGEEFVVPLEEYKKNIEQVIQNSSKQKIYLIDTVPNRELFRNAHIKKYNALLDELASKYKNCYKIDIYDVFEKNLTNYYLDDTHINDAGYEVISKKLFETYKKC
jgi:lysophospholipase L1-like esterase